MNRVNFLSSGAAAEYAKLSKVAAEEFSATAQAARADRASIPKGAHPRLVTPTEIARGPRAPAFVPKSGIDKFYINYHNRYIKRGSPIPLVHVAVIFLGVGILVEAKHHHDAHAHAGGHH